jgi:hypothetical protein
VLDAHRDSRLDLSGCGSLHSSWNGCCFRSIGTTDAMKSTFDVRRTQKWIKHCTHHLQLYFQGFYVKVESKSFLCWYWMLFLVVYKRRKRANWSSDHGGVCWCEVGKKEETLSVLFSNPMRSAVFLFGTYVQYCTCPVVVPNTYRYS